MYTNIVFGNDLCDTRSKRASVVPYTFVKNPQKDGSYLYEIYLLMGIHAKSGEVTDFGGGVKKAESDVEASLRELNEETFGMFNDVTTDNLKTCVAISRPKCEKTIGPTKTKVYVEGISAIFLPVSNEWFEKAERVFKKASLVDSEREIRSVMWIKGSDFLRPTTRDYKVWSFMRKFYYESLSSELNEMLFVKWNTCPPV